MQGLTENVASMDAKDCAVMNSVFGMEPWFIDADGIGLAHRPRLYGCDWEFCEAEGVEIYLGSGGKLPLKGQVDLRTRVDTSAFLEPGYTKGDDKAFPTFTTSRPSPVPLRRPAGLKDLFTP